MNPLWKDLPEDDEDLPLSAPPDVSKNSNIINGETGYILSARAAVTSDDESPALDAWIASHSNVNGLADGERAWVGASNGHDQEPPEYVTDGPDQALSSVRPQDYSHSQQTLQEPHDADTWPEPLDLSQAMYRGMALPIELAPEALQPLIRDCAARTGIDEGAFFLGFIAGISTFANDYLRLQPKQNDHTWTVRPVIWPFAIGDSSSGKSPALETGMAIVQRKDYAAVVENTRKHKDYEHALKMHEDDCAAARKARATRPEEPPLPHLREYWVQRGTTEGVTRLLECSPKVIWYMNEGSGLINSWDRYAAGGKGSGDREFVLQLWDGGMGKNTLAGKTVSLANASAVLCGGSTPAAMVKSCAGQLQADGFLQRTLICMVRPQQGGADTTPDMRALYAYERILDNLLEMPAATLTLDRDAQLIYNGFTADLRALIAAETNDSLAAHLGKWYGLAPRLMLAYHLAAIASQGQFPADGQRIPALIAQQVCRLLMDWQLSHLRHFWLELMAEKKGRKLMQTISRYILANPALTTLNFRNHVTRPHWHDIDNCKPWEIKEAMNMLVSAAWLTPIEGRMNTYGVHPSYAINPKLPQMFEAQREREIDRRDGSRAEWQAKRRPN